MRKIFTGRRLAIVGVLLGTQLLTACCIPPFWYRDGGGRGGRGHYAEPPGDRGQVPAPRYPR
jgi:hypothetical protein